MRTAPSDPGSSCTPFAGKIFVISGTLARRARADAPMSIEARGGQVVASPLRKTDHLLAGDKAGTKLAKARELRVTVLSEDEFDRMVQAADPMGGRLWLVVARGRRSFAVTVLRGLLKPSRPGARAVRPSRGRRAAPHKAGPGRGLTQNCPSVLSCSYS